MKFQTHNQSYIGIMGTSLQGGIQATRSDLERTFGTPTGNDGEDKITTLWIVKFADGTVATIYDWKCREPMMGQSYNWHVGAAGRHGVELVHDAFREALGFAARAA